MTSGEKTMATVNGLLGRKVGMTSVFDDEGKSVPVTVIQCGPCNVVQRKTQERDGYDAVQLGYVDRKEARKGDQLKRGENGRRGRGEANSPAANHFKKHGGSAPARYVREFRLENEGDEPEAGATLAVADIFAAGDKVQVTGTSKGRGFAGVMKRYGFKGQNASHGSKIHRRAASNGATGPARVFPGVKRPGRMGSAKVTQHGLKVVEIDSERHLLVVKGAVPGAPGGLLRIEKSSR